MELLVLVEKWLEQPVESRDFFSGVTLFNHLPGNFQLKKIFAMKGPDSYNKSKLNNELKKYFESGKSIIVADNTTTVLVANDEDSTPVSILTSPGINPDLITVPVSNDPPVDYAPILEEMEKERKSLYMRSTFLHDRIDLIKDDKERHSACLEIYWNFQRGNQIFKIQDHFKKTGEFLKETPIKTPEKKEVPVELSSLGEAQLIQKRNNLRSQQTKARSRNQSEKLARVESELAIVESLLVNFLQPVVADGVDHK